MEALPMLEIEMLKKQLAELQFIAQQKDQQLAEAKLEDQRKDQQLAEADQQLAEAKLEVQQKDQQLAEAKLEDQRKDQQLAEANHLLTSKPNSTINGSSTPTKSSGGQQQLETAISRFTKSTSHTVFVYIQGLQRKKNTPHPSFLSVPDLDNSAKNLLLKALSLAINDDFSGELKNYTKLSKDSFTDIKNDATILENQVQAHFNSHAKSILGEEYYLDVSNSAKGTPFAASVADRYLKHHTTNRPDAISRVAPIFAELKKDKSTPQNDYKILAQCLGRIEMLMQRLSYLEKMVGFGVNLSGAWLVYVELKIVPKTTKEAWYVYVCRIDLDEVLPLWKLCHDAVASSPTFFCSKYAPTLAVTLQNYFRQDTLPLEYFCVKWLASSSFGTIFLVTPPEYKEETKKKAAIPSTRPSLPRGAKCTNSSEPTLALLPAMWDRRSESAVVLKLQSEKDGKAEIECLKVMCTRQSNHYAIAFYANSTFQSLSQSVQTFSLLAPDVYDPKVSKPWTTGNEIECAIVMHRGVPLDKPNKPILDGIPYYDGYDEKLSKRDNYLAMINAQTKQSLDDIHKAGFVHRDIRPPNIMHFGERGIQIIDYGYAISLGESDRAFPNASIPRGIFKIFESGGYDMEKFSAQAKSWGKELDRTMLKFTLKILETTIKEKYNDEMVIVPTS